MLRIADPTQAALQNKTTTMADVIANATPVDMRTNWWTGQGGFQYLANRNTTFKFDVQRTLQTGSQPYGATFGFSNDIEIAKPIDQQLTDVTASAEYVRGRGLFRVGYEGSYFHNNLTSITWDNPYAATDSASTSSQGRQSVAPSNYLNTVNGMASFKLPYRSRVTGYLSLGQLKSSSGVNILPMTINSATTPIALERTALDGDIKTTAANLNFTSHPNRLTSVDVRYKFYNMDNRTPVFTEDVRIPYDNTAAAGPFETEPYSVKRNNFDASVRFTPGNYVGVGVGYERQQSDYNYRIYSSTVDQVANVTFDVIGSPWLTLRTHYDHAQRRGSGFDAPLLEELGEQPDLRHFDVANRDEDKVLMTAMISPTGNFSINLSGGTGKDNYPDAGFGLQNSKNGMYSLGFDATPVDNVTFGAAYTLEEFRGVQTSRTANPGAQQLDPTRNWSDHSHDWTHSLNFNADIAQIGNKVELRFNYDLSRAKSTYVYTLTADTTLPTPTQLPPVFNQLQRGTVDAIYSVNPRLSLGLSYWYERYQVEDFALDAQAIPSLALGTSTLLTGYTFLPYRANTVWGRIMYHW